MADSALASVLDPNNPAIKQYQAQAPELLTLARELEITSDEGLIAAAEHTRTASGAVKAIKLLFKPAKQAIDNAKAQIIQLENNLLLGFQQADEMLRAKVTNFNAKRLEQARKEQREREAAERKIREDEQIATAARLETLAKTTGDAHFQKAAEATLNAPVRQPVIKLEMPKPAGMTFRVEIGVDVFDLDALVKAVAAGEVGREALTANTSWLAREAKSRGEAMADGDLLFPGVSVTKRNDVTVRTR